MVASLIALVRQFAAFSGVGVVATLAHYGVLVSLVELGGAPPTPAAGAGYAVGGLVSYLLNRRHVFETGRTHVEAGWRFGAVMAVGFTLTLAFMALFADRLGLPYLMAQIITTGLVLAWNFTAHKLWTFGR